MATHTAETTVEGGAAGGKVTVTPVVASRWHRHDHGVRLGTATASTTVAAP